jgi:hypothetical protein
MEFGVWEVSKLKQTVVVIGIYRPPYSTRNKYTDAMFLTDLWKWFEGIYLKYGEFIVLGDFNIH